MHVRLGTPGVIGILAAIGATGVGSFMAGRASVGAGPPAGVAQTDPAASNISAAAAAPAPENLPAAPLVHVPLPEMEAVIAKSKSLIQARLTHRVDVPPVALVHLLPDEPTFWPDLWNADGSTLTDPSFAAVVDALPIEADVGEFEDDWFWPDPHFHVRPYQWHRAIAPTRLTVAER